MLDTDATVTTGLLPSIFDRLPTGFGDPDPPDLDRLAASLDYLALSCCKPALDEPSQPPPAEAMAELHFAGAVPTARASSSSARRRPERWPSLPPDLPRGCIAGTTSTSVSRSSS